MRLHPRGTRTLLASMPTLAALVAVNQVAACQATDRRVAADQEDRPVSVYPAQAALAVEGPGLVPACPAVRLR